MGASEALYFSKILDKVLNFILKPVAEVLIEFSAANMHST